MVIDDLLRDIANPDEVALLTQFADGIVVPLIYQTRLSGVFLMSGKLSSAPVDQRRYRISLDPGQPDRGGD